jgi:serine/threonine protein kinase
LAKSRDLHRRGVAYEPRKRVGHCRVYESGAGEKRGLDARTHLFSFGIVPCEMATGQRAFTGSTSAVVFETILNKSPVSPVRLNADLPEELERIINKALENDHTLQYQSASEMRAELKRLRRASKSGWTAVVAEAPVQEKPAEDIKETSTR